MSMMRMRSAVAGGLLVAQTPAKSPEIEVASVKPSDPGTSAMNNHF